ncbi:hypothetical protein ALC53_03663 [Atta colombica]|uniref:Uncharacterized protein n=1 Tax=Atta colombica TaxID=520822 RepID=A0A195BNH5_9HYME|nr:hypothetical protein ALC53_03663 [Atta colombica]
MKPTRSGMSLKGSAIHVVGFSVRLHRHQECPEMSATSRALTTRRPHVELGTPRSQDHCNFSGPSAKIVANKRCLITKITSSVGLQDGWPDDFLATMSDVTRPSRRDAPLGHSEPIHNGLRTVLRESLLSTRPRNGTRQM